MEFFRRLLKSHWDWDNPISETASGERTLSYEFLMRNNTRPLNFAATQPKKRVEMNREKLLSKNQVHDSIGTSNDKLGQIKKNVHETRCLIS